MNIISIYSFLRNGFSILPSLLFTKIRSRLCAKCCFWTFFSRNYMKKVKKVYFWLFIGRNSIWRKTDKRCFFSEKSTFFIDISTFPDHFSSWKRAYIQRIIDFFHVFLSIKKLKSFFLFLICNLFTKNQRINFNCNFWSACCFGLCNSYIIHIFKQFKRIISPALCHILKSSCNITPGINVLLFLFQLLKNTFCILCGIVRGSSTTECSICLIFCP